MVECYPGTGKRRPRSDKDTERLYIRSDVGNEGVATRSCLGFMSPRNKVIPRDESLSLLGPAFETSTFGENQYRRKAATANPQPESAGGVYMNYSNKYQHQQQNSVPPNGILKRPSYANQAQQNQHPEAAAPTTTKSNNDQVSNPLLSLPKPTDRSHKRRVQYESEMREKNKTLGVYDGELEPEGFRGQEATVATVKSAEYSPASDVIPHMRTFGETSTPSPTSNNRPQHQQLRLTPAQAATRKAPSSKTSTPGPGARLETIEEIHSIGSLSPSTSNSITPSPSRGNVTKITPAAKYNPVTPSPKTGSIAVNSTDPTPSDDDLANMLAGWLPPDEKKTDSQPAMKIMPHSNERFINTGAGAGDDGSDSTNSSEELRHMMNDLLPSAEKSKVRGTNGAGGWPDAIDTLSMPHASVHVPQSPQRSDLSSLPFDSTLSSASQSNATAQEQIQSVRSAPRHGPSPTNSNASINSSMDPDVINSQALQHVHKGEYDLALAAFAQVLEIYKSRYGEVHPMVASAYHNLGTVHAKRASLLFDDTLHQRHCRAQSLQCFQLAARAARDSLGKDHPNVAVSLVRIGFLLLQARQYNNAVITFQEALRIREAHYGMQHGLVANLYNNLGVCYMHLGRFPHGRELLDHALQIQRAIIHDKRGSNADVRTNLLELADTLFNIGGLCLEWIRRRGPDTRHATDAEVAFTESLALRESVLGPKDPLVLQVRSLLDMAKSIPRPKSAMPGSPTRSGTYGGKLKNPYSPRRGGNSPQRFPPRVSASSPRSRASPSRGPPTQMPENASPSQGPSMIMPENSSPTRGPSMPIQGSTSPSRRRPMPIPVNTSPSRGHQISSVNGTLFTPTSTTKTTAITGSNVLYIDSPGTQPSPRSFQPALQSSPATGSPSNVHSVSTAPRFGTADAQQFQSSPRYVSPSPKKSHTSGNAGNSPRSSSIRETVAPDLHSFSMKNTAQPTLTRPQSVISSSASTVKAGSYNTHNVLSAAASAAFSSGEASSQVQKPLNGLAGKAKVGGSFLSVDQHSPTRKELPLQQNPIFRSEPSPRKLDKSRKLEGGPPMIEVTISNDENDWKEAANQQARSASENRSKIFISPHYVPEMSPDKVNFVMPNPAVFSPSTVGSGFEPSTPVVHLDTSGAIQKQYSYDAEESILINDAGVDIDNQGTFNISLKSDNSAQSNDPSSRKMMVVRPYRGSPSGPNKAVSSSRGYAERTTSLSQAVSQDTDNSAPKTEREHLLARAKAVLNSHEGLMDSPALKLSSDPNYLKKPHSPVRVKKLEDSPNRDINKPYDTDIEDGIAPLGSSWPDKSFQSDEHSKRNQNFNVQLLNNPDENIRAIYEEASLNLKEHHYVEALELFGVVLQTQKKKHGPLHQDVAAALHNVGIAHLRNGNLHDALKSFEESARIRKGALGKDHPHVAASLVKVGMTCLLLHRFEEALYSFREALSVRKHALGTLHPSTARIYNNIGCVHVEFNEFREARRAFEAALDIQRNALCHDPESGPIRFGTATTLCNLGYLYRNRGMYERAVMMLKEAANMQENILGPNHSTVLSTLDNLAEACFNGGQTQAALQYYQTVLERFREKDDPRSRKFRKAEAVLMYKMSQVYRRKNDRDSQLGKLQQALKAVRSLENSQSVTPEMDNMSELDKRIQADIREAREDLEKSERNWI